MPIFAALLVATAPAAVVPAPSELQPGSPAPEFALADLDGKTHRLADLRGRIVVLEWTSHLCPAVAWTQESGIAADTRAVLAGEDLSWLQVDSSWFARELESDVRAWRERLAIAAPYLLDADGAVAKAYGASATPQLFVIDAKGRLAYLGAWCDDDPEDCRRNYVVEAVLALRQGRPLKEPRTRAPGCTLKLGPPKPGEEARSYDENAAAVALYVEAAASARKGEHQAALDSFDRALAKQLPWPTRVLADESFRGLLADAEARASLRRMLADRPARGSLRMTAPGEPGEPFVLCGTVRAPGGQPIAGALISLFQTDDAGWYKENSTEGENARLFGLVTTDRDGSFRIRSIVPARYAPDHDSPAHVHIGFRAEGFRPHEGHRASVFFQDDPTLVGEHRDEIAGDGCAILPRVKNAEGVTTCVYDVVLRPG